VAEGLWGVSCPDPYNPTAVGTFGAIVKRATVTPRATATPRPRPSPRHRPT
jgi:hypothetical protein